MSKVETSLVKNTAQPKEEIPSSNTPKTTTISLGKLYRNADDALQLADEYLGLVRRYPTSTRAVIFHTRRIGMLKNTLSESVSADGRMRRLSVCRSSAGH
jgi:hypothetical protein